MDQNVRIGLFSHLCSAEQRLKLREELRGRHRALLQPCNVSKGGRAVVRVIERSLHLLHKLYPGSGLAITQDLLSFHIRPLRGESFSSNFAQCKKDLCQIRGIDSRVRHEQEAKRSEERAEVPFLPIEGGNS